MITTRSQFNEAEFTFPDCRYGVEDLARLQFNANHLTRNMVELHSRTEGAGGPLSAPRFSPAVGPTPLPRIWWMP